MQDVSPEQVTNFADASAAPAPPLSAPATGLAPESHPFQFTGTAGGFFAIWIVNLFLTIVTLGIYSAWAKVRKKRYLYGHTWVGGANFEYHGNPVAILKGRLIAVAAFASYSGVGHFMPQLAAALALVLFIAAPWFIARSMAFNAWNSSYRNIRFRFHATYYEVLRTIWPFALVLAFPFMMPEWDPTTKAPPPVSFWVVLSLQMLTLAGAYPFVVGSLKRLHVNHSQYGAAPFTAGFGLGAIYKIYFFTLLLAIAAGIAAGSIGTTLAMLTMMLLPVVVLLSYFGIGALLVAYTRSRIGNLVFNTARLDDQVTFTSNLRLRRLTMLYLTNLFAILFSAGLAIPWAVVRVMRYRAECLSLQSAVPLDAFVGAAGANVGATGEELGEFFNIDLSL